MKDVKLCKKIDMRYAMYNIGICDDGENVCAQIEEMLIQYAKKNNVRIEVNVWYTGESLKDYLSQGNHLDILFLDIELFKLTGIEVGAYIRNCLDNMGMQIIYISGKASYAWQLFRTQPLDFLVKPILQEQVDDIMERAIRIIKKKNERFEFKNGRDYYYVPMGEIIYLGSEGRKIKVVTAKERFEFYGKLKDVNNNLNEDFVMIHQSSIVNRNYIFRYAYDTIELIDGTILTISIPYRKRIREILLKDE
jgi:DNA-binding LytR/AlgR family response regulator